MHETIAVIGSVNVDFHFRCPRLPDAGETLATNSFDVGFGGKGANQAVSCVRLAEKEVRVAMVGNVGDDQFGADYLVALEGEGMDVSGIRVLKDKRTGISAVVVDDTTGENRIMFAAGANSEYLEKPSPSWDLVPSSADVVIFQMEIPLDVVLHNMRVAQTKGMHVLLNPAPAGQPLPESAYPYISTLVMNETESMILSGKPCTSLDALLLHFLNKGVRDTVIITMGGAGLVYARSSGEMGRVAAEKVHVVDTTAAGDTFIGAYAAKLVKGIRTQSEFVEALQFASRAASKAVERRGAMASIPFLSEV